MLNTTICLKLFKFETICRQFYYLKKDIMWNGCEVSDNLMHNCHQKSKTWMCVNPNNVSTNRRKIQHEQHEQMKFNENFSRLVFRNIIKDLTRELKLIRERKKTIKMG